MKNLFTVMILMSGMFVTYGVKSDDDYSVDEAFSYKYLYDQPTRLEDNVDNEEGDEEDFSQRRFILDGVDDTDDEGVDYDYISPDEEYYDD